MKKTVVFIVLTLTLSMGDLFAQDPFEQSLNKFDLDRNITLNSAKQKEIPLDITSKTKLLKFEIDCKLHYNELSIEILDPKGNNIGNFTVENMRKYKKGQKAFSAADEYVEIVTGQIYKVVRGTKGRWKILVKPKREVYAQIHIKISQIFHDN